MPCTGATPPHDLQANQKRQEPTPAAKNSDKYHRLMWEGWLGNDDACEELRVAKATGWSYRQRLIKRASKALQRSVTYTGALRWLFDRTNFRPYVGKE